MDTKIQYLYYISIKKQHVELYDILLQTNIINNITNVF